jgi:MFS family permease
MSDSAPPTPPAAPFTHREIVVILLGLMLGMSLAVIDMTILGAALSKISDDLQAGETISWIVSIYLLVSTAVTPIYGKLSDL